MLRRIGLVVRSGVVLGWGAACVFGAAGESSPKVASTARLIRYSPPFGEDYFALSLRAPVAGARVEHDHVLLVDTSASQTGGFREQGLAVLEAFLAALPATDRVSVYAIDVSVQPLTDGFVGPQSAEAGKALAHLKRRVPLGASKMLPALHTAAAALQSDRAKSIVYIGDGMSTGGLVAPGDLRATVQELHTRHIPVHTYCLGPRTDLQMTGLLAVHTGGVVLLDENVDDARQPAAQLGRQLAEAVGAPVFFAESLRIEPAPEQLLPQQAPPLRSDRDTIVLGRGLPGEALRVTVAGEGRSAEWSVAAEPLQAGQTFLAALWSEAEASAGLAIAVAGQDLLNVAREAYEQRVAMLAAAGKQAVASRDLKQAEQIAREIQRMDPANVESTVILGAAQKVQAITRLARYAGEESARPPAAGDTGTVRSDDLTSRVEAERQVRTERLTKDVRRVIEAARRAAKQRPDDALGELKRSLNTVVSATEIDAADRDRLQKQVERVIDEVQVQLQKNEQEKIHRLERMSAEQARRFAVDELVLREEQLKRLIDEVRTLLNEGYSGREQAFEESEAVARAAWELAPYHGVTAAAIFNTEAAGQLDKMERLRAIRADLFLETLYQVELSHIPFPDEPPIIYPAPEVWKALTERRRKWASVDLTRPNAVEERIYNSLSKPTEVTFQGTALEDAVRYLKEFHEINIILDRATLIDEGIALDTPVSLDLAGVTFRSVLKLLLEPLQLTYVIEDEVMKITTITKADEALSVRVYPVADLVIPIRLPRGGGGQGLGGVGGFGGAGGGGAGFGGGGMGGGMGMFNIADDVAQAEFNNDAVRNRKKKLPNEN